MGRVTQAVILAGGLGTRLLPLTKDLPKPLAPVNGKPFIDYLLELLAGNGITDVVLLLGYLSEKVRAHCGDGSRYGLSITYSVQPVEYETGKRVKAAEALLDDEFLLLYCDNYWPLDLARLEAFHRERGKRVTMTVFTNNDGTSRDNVRVEDGVVTAYDPTRKSPGLRGVEIGFMIVPRGVVSGMGDGNASLRDTQLRLVAEGEAAGFETEHKYYSIGSFDRLKTTEEYLRPRKVLFLDRDGVINRKAPKADYVKRWSEFSFLPGAVEALERLAKEGWELYLISNQAGIARGMMTEEDLSDIHARMQGELAERGVSFKGIYHCPHGWDEGCPCRKPKPGMFFRAASEHALDLTRSVFVGDDERDRTAGDAAGVKTILVPPEEGLAAAHDLFTQ